ncbi:MAG: hypothetical protein JWO22_853 [Frankiales bacterium]|nr:hypothetical protein [Frankiales bacterium]
MRRATLLGLLGGGPPKGCAQPPAPSPDASRAAPPRPAAPTINGVEAGRLLRAARRQSGLSQRDLAALAGVSSSTVASAELHGANPSWCLVQQLLDAAGASLALGLPARLPRGAEGWLSASTSARLHWVLTGLWPHRADNASPAWIELRELAVHRVVVLSPELSIALWLPSREVRQPSLTVATARNALGHPLPDSPSWEVTTGPVRSTGLVAVGVSRRWEVFAYPPDAPVLHSDPVVSSALRAVADLLDSQMPRDAQGRRRAAHTDSRAQAELDWAWTRRRFGRLPLPDPLERRDWRLGGASSFREWLLLNHYPLPDRRGSHEEDSDGDHV